MRRSRVVKREEGEYYVFACKLFLLGKSSLVCLASLVLVFESSLTGWNIHVDEAEFQGGGQFAELRALEYGFIGLLNKVVGYWSPGPLPSRYGLDLDWLNDWACSAEERVLMAFCNLIPIGRNVEFLRRWCSFLSILGICEELTVNVWPLKIAVLYNQRC